MYEIGLSTPSGEAISEELFKKMSEAGIKYSEISVSDALLRETNLCQVFEWAQKWGITIWSLHLPFYPFSEYDISKPELAEKTVEYLEGYVKKGTALGIKNYVIHASGEPIDESERALRMETAKKSLYTLAEIARIRGSRILVEDLPRTCLGRDSNDILELISVHPSLEVVFDTNHLLKEDPIKFIHVLGKKIKSTHVSDYDFKNERHWLPGEGKLDWQGILKALMEVGYDGPWLYEVELDAPKTIDRDRRLTLDDFVNNANVLFKGEIPAPIGTPKDNL